MTTVPNRRSRRLKAQDDEAAVVKEEEEPEIKPETKKRIKTEVKSEECNKRVKTEVKEEEKPKIKKSVKEEDEPKEEEEEEEDPLATAEADVMPSSLSRVIRLMDDLEPGSDYYDRQEDSRGECSKMRGKLRNFAKKHQTNPATVHWLKSGNWAPPNAAVLRALMVLIRGMINKSWPQK